MKEKKNIKQWLYWFIFAVAVIAVYKIIDSSLQISEGIHQLLSVLMPFIIAILVAYIFYLPARGVEKIYKKSKIKILAKKARTLSVITTYIIAILILILAIKFILPTISSSLLDLINNLPKYYQNAKIYVEQLPENSILNQINVKQIIGTIENLDLKQIINIENITYYAKGILGFAMGIFDSFVALIVSIYILIERAEILAFLKRLSKAIFKEKTNENLSKYFKKANDIFFKFISSQVLDAIVVGILTSIVMLILDVKYAVLLGFMIGLFNIIPYFGAIIAVIIAVIITLFTGGFSQALWMAITVIIVQQIDANIINPKIVGNSLKLSPILVIFAVTIGGAYFGVLGMFLAVPIITVLKILIDDYIEYKNKI